MTKVTMRPLGWVLIQYNQCPFRKRISGHRHAGKDPVKTAEKHRNQQQKGGDIEETTLLTFALRFPACRTVRKQMVAA